MSLPDYYSLAIITIPTIISLIYICAMHLTRACVVAAILDRIEEGRPTLLIPLFF